MRTEQITPPSVHRAKSYSLLAAALAMLGGERDSAIAQFDEVPGSGLVGRPEIPPTKPAHGPFFVDDAGRIWVQPAEHAMTWDVLSGDGELLGRIAVPLPFARAPSARGDRMALSTVGIGLVHLAVVDDLVCPEGFDK